MIEQKKPTGWAFLCLFTGGVLLFCVLVWAVNYAFGMPSNVNSLGCDLFASHFTCEWVSDDGKQAILLSDTGNRRLVDLRDQKSRVVVGKTYERKMPTADRWGDKTPYLAEVRG